MAKKLTQVPKKRTLLITIVTIITLVIAWLSYNWYIHYQDRQKFMTLRADMLALQAEFNKIDPGWQYSESCHAKGEKFKEREASSCWVEIRSSREIEIDNYRGSLKTGHLTLSGDVSTINDYGDLVTDINGNYDRDSHVICGYSMRKSKEEFKYAIFGCHDSALDFYFPRSQ